jgi:MoaA/NifB/PqqE/SkfB family radical SAM enzyme
MINKIVPVPNFSIILPGGCNAKCDFCFWQQEKATKNYVAKLSKTLSALPEYFRSISLTGGEPTLSKHLEPVLHSIDNDRWDRIVLTTNGTNLLSIDRELLSEKVNFINISRRSVDDNENWDIFNSKSVPRLSKIECIIDDMNKIGIPVNINCVLRGQFKSKEDVFKFIYEMKNCNASSITFRVEQNTEKDSNGTAVDVSLEESWFSDYQKIYDNECPVCRSVSQIIRGIKVSWKSAYNEPSKQLNDVAYEAIFHPSGKVTSDWESTEEIDLNNLISWNYENNEPYIHANSLEESKDNYIKELENALDSLQNQMATTESELDRCESLLENKKIEIEDVKKVLNKDKGPYIGDCSSSGFGSCG